MAPLVAEVLQGTGENVALKMLHGIAVRPGLLVLAAEAVEIGQGLRAVQGEAQLPPRPEFEQEEHQTLPGQEHAAVGDRLLIAGVGQIPHPDPIVREEAGPGARQGRAAVQALPARRAGASRWPRIRTSCNWLISRNSRRSRWCSRIDAVTSSVRSLGT